MRRDHKLLACLLTSLIFLCTPSAFPKSNFPFPGEKPEGINLHALYGGDIQVNPFKRIKNGTLLIRDGIIEKVGADIAVPPHYREWNCSGKTIYPGFIDPYLLVGNDDPELLALGHQQSLEATSNLSFVGLPMNTNHQESNGFGINGVHPERMLVNSFGTLELQWKDFRSNGFTSAHLAPSKGIFRGTGPFILLSEDPNEKKVLKEQIAQTIAFDPVGREHTPSTYPNSLMGVLSVIRQTYLEVEYAREMMTFKKEHAQVFPFRLNAGIRSLLQTTEPLTPFPTWFEPGSSLMCAKALEIAVENNLEKIVLILTAEEWRRPDLALSLKHDYILPLSFPEIPDLPTEEDWEQVSLDQLRAWDHAPSFPKLVKAKSKSFSFTTSGCNLKEFNKNLRKAVNRGLSKEDALAALTINPANICGISNLCGTLESGKLANFFIIEGPTFFTDKPMFHSTWITGRPEIYEIADIDNDQKTVEPKTETTQRTAHFPSRNRKYIDNPEIILFKNFHLWTCEQEGILRGHDLLVRNTKISAIGKNLSEDLPKGTHIIEGKGKHLTPGIIDCHSHAMILGGVNESTLPSTAMVRVADVINSESINIERQLAGGVTTCNLLHGSANPIGGQNAVIKLRLGASPKKLLFQNAPAGIKFALGENVKQSNWGDKFKTRFPQSRMGVKTFFENRFNAAIDYERRNRQSSRNGEPFRRNLELEAILEIIQGKRLIHCHSYRQDEIVVFLRTMESFGVRVGSLQHVLEGYKVADEIARHGAGASTFSDWWAYKFEVYDAIPYAGALMHQRGCIVSFNSDSPDHARRLNLEAAKAVKYGQLPEHEALKFVTLNPAIQLGIDSRVGSLQVGKDADLATWTTNPLDYRAQCDQTWIEGRLFHDLKDSRKRNQLLKTERDMLVDKAKQNKSKASSHSTNSPAKERFFRFALEVACDLFSHSCRSHDCLNQKSSGQ